MKIESQKLSITDAFRSHSYIVPPYQREYVWKEKNVSQLLSDINEEYSDNSSLAYFYNLLIFAYARIYCFEKISRRG